jgi:hypothetical protein
MKKTITHTTTRFLEGFDDIRKTFKHSAANKQPDIKKIRFNELQRYYREGEMINKAEKIIWVFISHLMLLIASNGLGDLVLTLLLIIPLCIYWIQDDTPPAIDAAMYCVTFAWLVRLLWVFFDEYMALWRYVAALIDKLVS